MSEREKANAAFWAEIGGNRHRARARVTPSQQPTTSAQALPSNARIGLLTSAWLSQEGRTEEENRHAARELAALQSVAEGDPISAESSDLDLYLSSEETSSEGTLTPPPETKTAAPPGTPAS